MLHLNQTEVKLKHWKFNPERICINNIGCSYVQFYIDAFNKISISNLTNVVGGWMPSWMPSTAQSKIFQILHKWIEIISNLNTKNKGF